MWEKVKKKTVCVQTVTFSLGWSPDLQRINGLCCCNSADPTNAYAYKLLYPCKNPHWFQIIHRINICQIKSSSRKLSFCSISNNINVAILVIFYYK